MEESMTKGHLEALKMRAEWEVHAERENAYAAIHHPGNMLTLPKSKTKYVVGNQGQWLWMDGRDKLSKKQRRRLRRERKESVKGRVLP